MCLPSGEKNDEAKNLAMELAHCEKGMMMYWRLQSPIQ